MYYYLLTSLCKGKEIKRTEKVEINSYGPKTDRNDKEAGLPC